MALEYGRKKNGNATPVSVEKREQVVADVKLSSLLELLNVADMAINRTYLPECTKYRINALLPPDKESRQNFNSCTKIFRLKRFVYNPEECIMEKLKTFFLSLYHLPLDPSIFIIIKNTLSTGSKDRGDYVPGDFSLYIGLRTESFGKSVELQNMFKDNFCGTFLGSDLVEVVPDFEPDEKAKGDRDRYLTIKDRIENLVCLSAIPSVKKNTDDSSADIGLEQFIDSMRDKEYTAIMIATPVASDIVQKRKRDLENLYTRLSISRKQTFQFGENESRSVSKGISDTTGVSSTVGRSFSETNSHGHTSSRGGSHSTTSSSGSSSVSSGSGFSFTSSSGSSSTSSSNWSESDSWTVSKTQGTSETEGTSKSHSLSLNEGESAGSSKSISIECENKNVVDMMEKINDTLKHITESEAYGLWECAAYFTSDTLFHSMFAANNYRALVLGDSSSSSNCYLTQWEVLNAPVDNHLLTQEELAIFQENQRQNREYINTLFDYVKRGIHPVLTHPDGGYYKRDELFRTITPTHAVSGRDLPFFLSLPLKSVPGVVVDSIAAFERSVYMKNDADSGGSQERYLKLGEIIHMGQKEKDSVVNLALDKLTSHTFIAGSTGSGKSNTMAVILDGLIKHDINFLIVEPAKGEYKQDFHKVKQIGKANSKEPLRPINIFTTNPLCERLLHLNPFRFDPGIHVLEHVDRLLNIFGSCWELTAAMPAILKRAVEQSYESCGWDLCSSCFLEKGPVRFPTFATVVQELHNVIDNSDYSAEAKSNYTGALVTRVESLASGILRQIFCSEVDVGDEELFDSRTIVDLSRLGSPDTKTLIMGVLVMLLSEHRIAAAGKTNARLSHVTVLEEAHNLLKNSNNGNGSAIVAKSVEMISNAIAEMRTYGEGFIIVDQSPTAVDISAIKNTNTKIVMRLPEQRDCEAMANAMGLNKFQQIEIAKQGKGRAIVMQNDWTAAVMVAVDRAPTAYVEPPEMLDRKKYREMRIELALEIANFGDMLFRFHYEHYQPGFTLSSDTIIKDKAVREYRDDLKAFFDRLCGKYEIGMAKAREYSDLCSHYLKALDDGISDRAEYTRILFAKLIIDILQCENFWKEYLTKNKGRACNLVSLDSVLLKYLSFDAESGQEKKINRLLNLVRPFMYWKGVISCGGTGKDQIAFRKIRDLECTGEQKQTTPIGKA